MKLTLILLAGVFVTQGAVLCAEEKAAAPAKTWFAEIRRTAGAFTGEEKGLTGFFFSLHDPPGDRPLLTGYRYQENKVVRMFHSHDESALAVREIRAVGLKPFDFWAEVKTCHARLAAEAKARGEEFEAPGVADGAEFEIAVATSAGRFVLRGWNPASQINFYAPHSENIGKLKAVLDLLARYYGRTEFSLGN